MASSSRTAIRAARAAIRPAAPSQVVAFRHYASSADVDAPAESSSTPFDASPVSVYVAPSSQRKGAEGAVMKKFTGPGFPKIPGLRHLVLPYHAHLHPGQPLRELTLPLRRKGGRNESGQVVNRGRGGGHRQRLRIVDFHRLEAGEHDVVRIEYDPGRTAHIALVKSRQGSVDVGADLGTELAEMQLDPLEASEAQASVMGTAAERRKSRNEVKGGWSYILAPEGLRAGDVVVSYRSGIPHGIVDGWDNVAAPAPAPGASSSIPGSTDPAAPQAVLEPTGSAPESTTSRALGLLRTLTLKPGNVLPLYLIPAGTNIHNISMNATGRMQLCRSAGSYAQVVAHHGPDGEALGGAAILNMGGVAGPDGKITPKRGSVLVKLQSGEVRRLDPGCAATIGVVSNKEHHSTSLGKAGRNRWLGRRPTVRGLAMNACDHPHGGGRGKSKGNRHPRSVYGWLTKGKRTRRSKDKDGNKMVVSERPRGKASKK